VSTAVGRCVTAVRAGLSYRYSSWCGQANAVGQNSKSLLEFLEQRHKPELNEEETVRLAVQTLLEVALCFHSHRDPAGSVAVVMFSQIVESGAKSMEIAVLKYKQPIKFLEEAEITPIVAAIEAEAEAEAKRKEADE
jgi:20S proteasome subunit alpha 4